MSMRKHIFHKVLPSSGKSVSSDPLLRKKQDFYMPVTVYIHKWWTYFPEGMLQVNGIGKSKKPCQPLAVPDRQVEFWAIRFGRRILYMLCLPIGDLSTTAYRLLRWDFSHTTCLTLSNDLRYYLQSGQSPIDSNLYKSDWHSEIMVNR